MGRAKDGFESSRKDRREPCESQRALGGDEDSVSGVRGLLVDRPLVRWEPALKRLKRKPKIFKPGFRAVWHLL